MTKIAISLAAVLLLIVAIGYFAMRFLRADDTDDFNDLPAEPSRPRGRAGGPDWASSDPAATVTASPRRGAGGFAGADARPGQQDQPGRGGSARQGAGPSRGGLDNSGLDNSGFDTGGFDTPGFQDAGFPAGRSGAGRPAASRPDSGRPDSNSGGRSASRADGSRADGSRPAGARGARGGRDSREFAANRAGRGDDQAPDDRGYGDRRFSFNPQDVDDQPASDRGRAGASSGGRGWAASDAESTQLLGTGSRPDAGQRDPGRAAARTPASSRSGRGRRGGEMSGKDWDSLSDVDYWAELASDKSLTTPAHPAGSASRPQPDFPASASAFPPAPGAARSDRRARSGRADAAALADGPTIRNEAALASDVTAVLPGRRHAAAGTSGTPLLPGGPDSPAGRPAAPGSRRSRDLPARDLPAAAYGDPRSRPARPDPDGGVAALARLGGPGASGGRPPALDDDPLTSPSFPAIRDEDSRSYRSRRADEPSGESRPSGSRSPGSHSPGSHSSGLRESGPRESGSRGSGAHSSGGYGPSGPSYPAAAPDPLAGFDDRPSERGRRGRRARTDDYPSAYPVPGPTPTVPAAPPAPAARHRDYADLPTTPAGAPAGNPYGSYVSGSAPARPDSDAYGGYADGGYGASQETQRYSQPAGRHLNPAPGQSPLSYSGPSQPVTGYGAPGGPAGDHLRGGPAAGYPVSAHNSSANAVPIYAAPVPAGPESAPGGYGSSWYAAGDAPPGAHAQAPHAPQAPSSGPYGAPAAAGYPADGHAAGGIPAGGYGEPEYPAAAYSGSPYDQSAYLPEPGPGGQQDQNGYGSPDSGYGAGAYGGYPGY
jgi:hypothetical protein